MNLPLLSVKQIVADAQTLNDEARGVRHEELSIDGTKNQMDATRKGETDDED
jgi:hypothetical protein